MRNEQGSSLLIVLLTIALISIFSVTIVSVALSGANQFQRNETRLQSTNIAEMGIIYTQNKIIEFIGDHSSLSIDQFKESFDATFTGEQVYINDESYFILSGFTTSLSEVVNNGQLMIITFKSLGYIAEKDTTREIRGSFSLQFQSGGGGGNHDQPYDDRDDFSKIQPPAPPVLSPPDLTYVHNQSSSGGNCHYPSSTQFTQTHNIRTDCSVDGDAIFNQYTTINNGDSLTVNGSLQLDRAFIMNQNSELTVLEDAIFKGYTNFLNNSEISIGRDGFFSGHVDLNQNAEVLIQGNAHFNQSLAVLQNAELTIYNDAIFERYVHFYNNSETEIYGNARFNNGFDISNNGTLYVCGNFIVSNWVDFGGGDTLTVGGSARFESGFDLPNNGSIMINGHAFFDQTIWNNNGRICVKGEATFQPGQRGVVNATSCDNQPRGTIYVLNQEIPVDALTGCRRSDSGDGNGSGSGDNGIDPDDPGNIIVDSDIEY